MIPNKQRGFSLVELMVSIALSLILMAGVLSIFFSSKVTYFANEKTARLQETGRIALDLMMHDVRSAGYPGCSKQVPITTLNTGTALWNYQLPIMGFESDGTGGYTPALTGLGVTLDPLPTNDSDVLVVRMLLRDGNALVTQADLASTTASIVVPDVTPQPISNNQVAIITDCNASTIFQVTGWNAGQISHDVVTVTANNVPGNSKQDLEYLYQAGARVLPIQTVVYWVGNKNGAGPALWRKMGREDPQMLIDGIEALQVAYGEDTNSDRIVDSYSRATATTNWDNIISVSLALLARSEESGAALDKSTYALLTPSIAALGGKTFNPTDDRRQRMIFTTTVVLRNRAL